MCGCVVAGGTGALNKTEGILRKENYSMWKILQHHLIRYQARILKLVHMWISQAHNDPKPTSNIVKKNNF